MPTWISGAFLYPISSMSAQALKAFAPQGANLAKQVAPVVGKAITSGDDNSAANATDQNRAYNGPSDDAPRVRVEKSP